MDERHWWFASRLQETFHFGGFDSPSLLEDFLSDPEVMELINSFLAPGEPRKLFFYCDEAPPTRDGSRTPSASSRRLRAAPELGGVSDRGKVCLYVLRADTSNEVEPAQMERELFCGEIRHSALSSLAALLCEAYNPLLHCQRHWGDCSEAAVASFLENFDKHSSALLETASLSQTRRPLLARPSPELQSLQQHGGRNVLSVETVAECEGLVGEWVNAVESLLLDATDERMEDSQSSPLSELSKWRQRHCLLTAVVEQLKMKEVRGVFAVLVAARSRLLKKWKTTDSQLTDAFNTARDRVRYLEALSPHLEALEASPSLPSLLSSLLPAVVTAVKKMEGLSRALARSGYLGILFTKISNALVRICTASLQVYCLGQEERDEFWEIFSAAVEAKMMSSQTQKEHPFLTRLSLCLQVVSYFTEVLYHLREVLVVQPRTNFSTQSPSVARSTVSLSGAKQTTALPTGGPGRGGLVVPGSSKVISSSISSSGESGSGTVSTGVGLQQVELITVGLRELRSRISQVVEMVSSLAQFQSLVPSLRGLPRVSGLWAADTPIVAFSDKNSLEGANERDVPIPEGSVTASDYLEQVFGRKEYPLPPPSSGENEKMETTPPEIAPPLPPSQSQTDSIAVHVWFKLSSISSALASSCPRGVSDVFSVSGRARAVFPAAHTTYTSHVATLERDMASYLRSVVPKMASSGAALDIVARFAGVREREMVGKALQTSTATAFSKYAAELNQIQTNYERQKGCPPVSPSLPPIAGALSWCRETLQRVSEPMNTFRGNTPLMQSVVSLEVCRLHNQLSRSLLQHDAFLISRWLSTIEAAQTALGLPLLIQETSVRDGELSPRVRVNCKQSLLDVMAESKALAMAGTPLPEVAKFILTQEVRVKRFRQSLQQVLDDFYSLLDSLDPPLRALLQPHTEALTRCLLPGCSSLTWSTLNIDAFLHQATLTVASFQSTVSRIQFILQDHVYSVLRDIAQSSLYDVELASSKTWAPRDFSDAMKSLVVKRASEVREKVAAVQRATLACIEIARGGGGEGEGEGRVADLRSGLLLAGVERKKEGKGFQSSGSRTSKQSSHSTRVHTTTASSHGGWARREGGWRVREEVGEGGKATLSYICGLVFNAVTEMVARSHCQLSAGLRGEGGRERDLPAETVTGKLSRSFLDLTGQRTIRFQDSQTVDNPRAVLTEFSRKYLSESSVAPLRLEARIKLSVPRLLMEPRLSDVHSFLFQLTSVTLALLDDLCWWAGPGAGREFLVMWDASGAVEHMHSEILERFRDLEPLVDLAISSLRLHDFLWREDMHAAYQTFMQTLPSQSQCCRHIERFLQVEAELGVVPVVFTLGPLQLSALPVTNSLTALALAWKLKFVSFLHDQAQTSLRVLVESREKMSLTLGQPVEDLAQLRETLQLLTEIQDLQSSIDDQFSPVENLYSLLRRYTLSLPRSEVVEVESLRDGWEELLSLADSSHHRLLHEERHIHERETEKQVRELQVEMIRFRNSFDTGGPLVPGLTPHTAIERLEAFSQQCEELQNHRQLLCAVQTLLSLPISSFPELDQTREDLSHLHLLYFNYSQFLQFNQQFRQTLWQEVQLSEAEETLERLWEDTAQLPPVQQEWSPTQQLRADICHYRDLLPLLTRLHSREVRNRHWLQVMRVTNCTFQLEGSILRLSHILDASLLMYEEEIERIVRCALKELELENEFRAIEDRWNEQVLQFTSYKDKGEVLLDVDHTHFLCEGLEGAGLRLAAMLVSDHVTHMRDEVVQWAGRLSRVHDLLTEWLEVQEQWRQLDSVFSASLSSHSFLDETARFDSVTASWAGLMASARASPGVMEWCEGGEEGREVTLKKLREQLLLCKRSLSLYLLSKREAFPRFFFLTDDALLEILSSPLSPSSLTPHLPSLFTSTRSLLTHSTSTPTRDKEEDPLIITAVESAELERLDLTQPVTVCGGVEVWLPLLLRSLGSSLSSLLTDVVDSEDVPTGLPCQVASLSLYLKWTRDTELALSQCRYDKRALPGLRSKFVSSVLGKLTQMLVRSRRRTGDLVPPNQQQRLQALTSLAVWLRDIVEDLCHQKIRNATDFEWQRYPRLYTTSDPAHSAPPTLQTQLELRCLHMKIEYGFEYTGCQALPVFTPRMNSYMISLMQGMELGRHSLVCGPRDSGKEEMMRGAAQLLGRFMFLYRCTAHSDSPTLERITEGLAQSGGWGCFADIHTLPRNVLSVVSHTVEAVWTAVQDKLTVFRTPSGREAQLKQGMLAVFTSTGHTPWPLPPSLAPIFRTFRLPPLDPSIFLLASCTALGLRSARQLTCKLVSLHHMANQQLETRLPLLSLCHVLREVRSCRMKPTASHTHQIKSDAAVTGRHVEEQCSHRQLTGHPSQIKEAHHGQKTISLVTTPPLPQPLPPSAAREHVSVAQLVCTILAPRFNPQEKPVFLEIVKSAFALHSSLVGVASLMQAMPTSLAPGSDSTIDNILTKVAKKARLVSTDTWKAKVKEILSIVQLTNRNLVLTGNAASGKTSALNTAAGCLNTLPSQGSKVEIHRVFPGAFDDTSTLIGRFSSDGAWEDGVCVSLIRKGLMASSSSSHWVCLDGDPADSWLHPLTDLSSGFKTLSLPSGERVVGGADCGLRLVLETGNLHAASPASLQTSAVVFFGSEVLSWKPLIEVWLRTRPGSERGCLRRQLPVFLGPVVEMVCEGERGRGSPHSQVGITHTCLAYLSSLLNIYSETAESFSEIHVVRLLVFSLIWSFGAVLRPGRERGQFGQLLKSLTNSLPDDDTQFSVFDYFVDESGEWDVWQTRLPALLARETTPPPVDLLGSVFVDTTDTVRVELLLELALSAGRSPMLTGPRGAGKTSVCRHFLHARALSHVTTEGVCHLSLDGHASSASLHQFMEVFLHHSQGSTYKPQDQKTLHLFIDDLHLSQTTPTSQQTTPPSTHEYLRQLVDTGGVYTLGRPNTFSAIENLSLFTSFTTSSTRSLPSPRLLRHFATITLPELDGEPLTAILTDSLRSLCAGRAGLGAGSGIGDDLAAVVETTAAVFREVRECLRASELPGRHHYLFSLTDIESVFQGLYHCLSSGSAPGLGVSWYHEMTRCLASPLSHSGDRLWLTALIRSHAEKLPGGLPSSLPHCLSAVPMEIKQGDEQPAPEATPINQLPEVELHPLCDWDDMKMAIGLFLMRCQQDWGNFPLSLSTNNTSYIIRLHRALKMPRGNCILCGPLGQQLHSLAKFSLYLAGYQLRPLDCSSPSSFRSSLRALFRRAGLEGRPVAAILTEEDVKEVEILQKLNSLFATGELPTLFTNDEMNGILQALAPSIKKDFASEDTHPSQYFTARISRYLRFVLCLSPSSSLLTSHSQLFPGLLGKCQLMWVPGWTDVELSNSLSHFFSTSPLSVPLIRAPLYECMRGIHQLVLKQSGHLQLAGHLPSSKPVIPGQHSSDSSSLTSFQLLMEGAVEIEREVGGHNSRTGFAGEFSLPYVGPLTFLSFLENFRGLYSRKKSASQSDVAQLEKALQSLERTGKKVAGMRESLSELEMKHTAICQLCSELLAKLTKKSCQVERVKALLRGGGSVMNAITLTSEQERAMVEGHKDEGELLASLLGGWLGKKGSRLELQLETARERERAIGEEEREAREATITARDEVQHYEERIDRNMVDQIKSLPSPPAVVCTVMQVMLALLNEPRPRERGEVSDESLRSGSLSTGSGHFGQQRHRQGSMNPHTVPSLPALSPSSTPRESKGKWTAIKLAIGDSQNFLDLISALNWREGLTIEAVNLIKSYLDVEESGEGEGSSRQGLVSLSAARHAAEVVGTMFGFAAGIVRYTALHKTHLLVLQKLHRARERTCDLQRQLETEAIDQPRGGRKTGVMADTELREREGETETNEEGLAKLQEELRVLQEEFNRAAVKKHSLDKTCSQLSEGLKSATHLLESLRSRQEVWQRDLDHTPSERLLAANCLLAAAVSAYFGPYPTLTRFKLLSVMAEVCVERELVAGEEAGQLLNLQQFPLFIMGQPALHQLELEGLPPDPTSRQSACIISGSHTHSWPLVCDPFGMATGWLSRHYQRPTAVDFQSPSLHSTVAEAITTGMTLIMTGVRGERAFADDLVASLLRCPRDESDPHKIKIDEKEVEIDRRFKLLLVTTSLPENLPPELVAMTTVVLFWPEVGGVRNLLLDRLLWQQNTKIAQEREHLRSEVHQESVKVEETERELLNLLSRDDGCHGDHQSTRELLQINSSHGNARESLSAVLDALEQMERVQLPALSSLASRAALISSVVMATGISLPLYAVSYEYLVSVFLSFSEQSGSHIQGAEAVEKMTQFAYRQFSGGMLERDRLLLAFSLVLQLEMSQGGFTLQEIAYLLRPSPGRQFAVRGLAAQAGLDLSSSSTFSLGKRPYDWILESQWQALLMLTSRFLWAHKSLKFAFAEEAQGLQASFRHIFQSRHPEIYITQGERKINEKAANDGRNLLHVLLLNSAVRPDRLACSIQVVSEAVLLPPRSSYDMPVELRKFHKTCSKGKIPLVVFRDDPHLPTNQIRALASKLQVPLRVFCVHGTGDRELEAVKAAIALTSSQGSWLLIHSIQESPELVEQLVSLVHPPSDHWRLWLSVHAGSVTSLPVHLLHSVCRVVLETPSTLKSSLLHTLHSLPHDLLSASPRLEWLPLLHSVSLLFPLLCARREIHTLSWRDCPPFPTTLLSDFLHYLKTVAGTQTETTSTGGYAPLSWSGLRHMLTEVFFGSLICDPVDLCTLTSLVEAWIHPGGPRREPDLYHIPKLFFTPGTRPGLLCQEVESATPPLIISPHLCGLHCSPEIKIGHLETFLPALAGLISLLSQHAPPTDGDHTHWTHPLPHGRAEDYATRHLLIPPTATPEKLPSWVHVPSQLMEWGIGEGPIPIPHDIGSSVWSIKLALETTIRKIQEILPSGWSQEVVSEKLSHHQTSSSLSFHHFMTRETSLMNSALYAIHSSLSSLSLALQPLSHGHPHSLTSSPHLSQLTLSLLTHKVPSLWLESVGPTAAPPSWGLEEWVRDLAQRRVFLDHVLSVGVVKVPAYWLGAFFNPRSFLSVITQHVLQSQCSGCGATEDTFFLAEVTPRNKDHVRDPPPDGELFIYGCYLWGCRVERSASIEFQDLPSKHHSPTTLPLLHLALTTPTEPSTGEAAQVGVAKGAESKTSSTYHCPVFVSHRESGEGERREIFRLIVHNPEVSPARWAVRSISCTLRPF